MTLKKQARVVSLVIDFDDGTREILEFPADNKAFYTVEYKTGSIEFRENYYRHQLWWLENGPTKVEEKFK